MIKAGAVIFPRDRRCEFHQFRLVESLPQAREESVGNFHGSEGHGVRVFEREAFDVREIGIGAIAGQVRDLLGLDATRSADGRADVDSKRTPHQGCDAKLSQRFHFVVDEFTAHL